jgi:predicted outer membrane repeat protein
MSCCFFLLLVLAFTNAIDIATLADWPPTGALLSNTTYLMRAAQSLVGNASLTLTCAANCTLDCRAPVCFTLSGSAALELSGVTIAAANLRVLARISAISGAPPDTSALPSVRLVRVSWLAPLDDLVQIAAPGSVFFDNMGSRASPLPVRSSSLVSASVAGGSLRIVASHFVANTAPFVATMFTLNGANFSMAQSSIASANPYRRAMYVSLSAAVNDIVDVNVVDCSFVGVAMQLSNARRVVVAGSSLANSTLLASLRTGGSFSLKNCDGTHDYAMLALDLESRASDALLKVEVAANSTVEIESLTAAGVAGTSSPFVMTLDATPRAILGGSSVSLRNVTARLSTYLLSLGNGLGSLSSIVLENLRLSGDTAIANGRCPVLATMRQISSEAVDGGRILLDLDISTTTASVDVRDVSIRKLDGTFFRAQSSTVGNVTVQNITVSSSQVRSFLQINSASAASRISMSDVSIVDSVLIQGGLFAQPANGLASVARLTLRNCSANGQDLFRVSSATVEDIRLLNVTTQVSVVNIQAAAAGAGSATRNVALRRFSAINCVAPRASMVRVQVVTNSDTPFALDFSELEFQNVSGAANDQPLVDLGFQLLTTGTNTSTAKFSDISIRNCTTKTAIRLALSAIVFSGSGTAGLQLSVTRVTATDVVGGVFEYQSLYSQAGTPAFVTVDTVTAERVSGSVLRFAGLSSVNVVNLRATNCNMVCDTQANRVLFISAASDVSLNGVFLANNAFCNTTNANMAGGAVQISTVANTVSVQDSVFDRQTGAQAALSLVDSARVTVASTRFDGNRGGGALQLQSMSNTQMALVLSVTDSFFRGNQGAQGAAIQANNAHVLVRGARFFDNVAVQRGGAIWLTCCQSKLAVSDSLFRNNSAGVDGGAIFASVTSASLTGSDFLANAIGGVNSTGSLLYLRGVAPGSGSVDIARISVTRNSVGANAGLLDVTGIVSATIGDSCMCTNNFASGAPEPATAACQTPARPLWQITNLTADTTTGCLQNNSAVIACSPGAVCSLRVPELQADPSTPAPTPPPTLPTIQPTTGMGSPVPSPATTDGGSGVTTTTTTTTSGGANNTSNTAGGPGGNVMADNVDIGLIVGCAVGGCAFLLVIIAVIAVCLSRRRRRQSEAGGGSEREMATARNEAASQHQVVSHYGSGLVVPPSNAGGSVSQYGSTLNSMPSSSGSASHYSGLEMNPAQPSAYGAGAGEVGEQVYQDARLRDAKQGEYNSAALQPHLQQQQQPQMHKVYNDWNN